MKFIISTTGAPGAIGPYSQATRAANLLFISGQLGINPETGELPASVENQTRQSLKNLCAILAAAGAGPEAVLKTTVFLASMNDFAKVNEIYAETFSNNPPARSCIAVAGLPKNALVEIEAIAALESN